jgi:hypothetical protein
MPFSWTNVPVPFLELMNRVLKSEADKFVAMFIDNILIYSPSEEAHKEHLKEVLQRLCK